MGFAGTERKREFRCLAHGMTTKLHHRATNGTRDYIRSAIKLKSLNKNVKHKHNKTRRYGRVDPLTTWLGRRFAIAAVLRRSLSFVGFDGSAEEHIVVVLMRCSKELL